MTLCAAILSMVLLQATPPAVANNAMFVTDLPADFLPEGVEWDAAHHRFLVSGIHQQRVAVVDAKTRHGTNFADAPGSVLGMHIDARGETVWAVWTKFGHAFKHNDSSGIIAWSLRDGHKLGQWPLPDKDPRVNLGDLAIIDTHTLVASDSGTGAIWRFDSNDHRYTQLVASGKFDSPQGLVPAHVAGTIVLAEYSTGLWHVDLKTGDATAIKAPEGAELRGLDGLYRHGDRIIAIQNGTKTPRVLAIQMDNDDHVVNVDKWLEMPGEAPALGTFRDGEFWFVANSQWDSYDDDLKPKPDAKLQPPQFRSLPLSSLDHPAH